MKNLPSSQTPKIPWFRPLLEDGVGQSFSIDDPRRVEVELSDALSCNGNVGGL